MILQLIRNATMKINYAGHTILTDPMFSSKGAFESFAGISPNPTTDLPCDTDKIIEGVEAVIVSHNHPDHIDEAAHKTLNKKLPIFCQPGDENVFKEHGFLNVVPVRASEIWRDITLTRTDGSHGSDKALEFTGKVSGFILQANSEPTVYWAGDTCWCEDLEKAIKKFKPEIIITHSGGATIPGFAPIIMDADQTIKTLQAAPNSKVVAVHMESLDHCRTDRATLLNAAEKALISKNRLFIPKDGESLTFNKSSHQ